MGVGFLCGRCGGGRAVQKAKGKMHAHTKTPHHNDKAHSTHRRDEDVAVDALVEPRRRALEADQAVLLGVVQPQPRAAADGQPPRRRLDLHPDQLVRARVPPAAQALAPELKRARF